MTARSKEACDVLKVSTSKEPCKGKATELYIPDAGQLTVDQTAAQRPGLERLMSNVERHATDKKLFNSYVRSLSNASMDARARTGSADYSTLLALVRASGVKSNRITDGILRRIPLESPLAIYRPQNENGANENAVTGLRDALVRVALASGRKPSQVYDNLTKRAKAQRPMHRFSFKTSGGRTRLSAQHRCKKWQRMLKK